MIGTGIGLRALYSGTASFLRTFGSWLGRWWSSRERPDRSDEEEELEEEPAPRRLRVVPEPEVFEEPEYEEAYEEEEEYEEEDEEEADEEYEEYPEMESDWELPSPSLLV